MSYSLPYVEIENKKYRLNLSGDAITKSRDAISQNNGAEMDASIIDKAIDAMIGDGSAAAIFEGTDSAPIVHMSVLIYIFEEATRYVNTYKRGPANVYKARGKHRH